MLVTGRTGEGPDPVVALHGITAQHRAFNGLAGLLTRPDGMLALDLRGRGDSGKPLAPYGARAHAGDVVRALDATGIDRAVLVGHSMGAFVATATAIHHPERVRALALLDGGWPRAPLGQPDDGPEQAPLRAGLAKAFARLSMTFPDPDAYLEWWFPGAGITMAGLPPALADYYRYDLAPVAGGWRPKASLAAARQDALINARLGPDEAALTRIRCPVVLFRASEGFAPGTPPLFSPRLRERLTGALGVRSDLLLEGATHYSMLFDEAHASRIAAAVDELAEATSGRPEGRGW
jgi:pimeloyl-ACP methyl ester carboxylesterase